MAIVAARARRYHGRAVVPSPPPRLAGAAPRGSGWRRWCTRRRWPRRRLDVVEFLVCLLLQRRSNLHVRAGGAAHRGTTRPLVDLSSPQPCRRRRAHRAPVEAWVASEVLVLSLYGQQVLGYSPLMIGLMSCAGNRRPAPRLSAGPACSTVSVSHAFMVGNCLLAAVSSGARAAHPGDGALSAPRPGVARRRVRIDEHHLRILRRRQRRRRQ